MEYKCFTRMTDYGLVFNLVVICMSIQMCVDGLCTSTCECFSYKMICKHGDIPTYISSEIRELYIERLDLNNFYKMQLQNVQNIQKLDIQADRGIIILSKSFDQFTNLTYLGLHGKDIRLVSSDAFLGLNNLLTLNLSSNPKLHIYQISKALNSENRVRNTEVLPSLLSLSIAKVKTSYIIPTDLNGYFFKSIASGRKLEYLDISDLNILRTDYSEFEPMCKYLKVLDIRKSIIGSAANFFDAKPCQSLRTLDISDIIIPVLRIKFTFQTFQTFNFFCETFKFYTYMETVLANNVITEHDLEINEYSLDMSKCPFQLQKVSFAGNKIKWMNMTVHLHETTKRSILEWNMSYNGLEYISPSVLLPSENIRILDFSNNKLSVMQEKYTPDFERLFWAQTELRYVNLSHNGLSRIPRQTFSENILLKVLDISYNYIEALDFLLNQLVSIEKIIVSHNRIHTIDFNFRMDLEMLLHRTYNNNANRNDTFHMYLEGNQFQCTCDKVNMKFLEWLHSTEIIDAREVLTCILQEDLVDIRDTGLAETKHFCKLQTIMKKAAITTPIVCVAVIAGIISVVYIKRRRKRKLMIREVIAQIKAGTFQLPHLAFLSHCNEDTDLVINKIYPELCEHLSEMTHSNNDLVCLGDKHFRPGFPLRDEVMRCVKESSVFVAIISRNFCRRLWCNLEIGEAYDQKKPIIMLMVEYVEKELMDDFLQKIFERYTHATWKPDDNGGHMEPEWKLFCKSVIQLAGKSIETANPVEMPIEIIN